MPMKIMLRASALVLLLGAVRSAPGQSFSLGLALQNDARGINQYEVGRSQVAFSPVGAAVGLELPRHFGTSSIALAVDGAVFPMLESSGSSGAPAARPLVFLTSQARLAHGNGALRWTAGAGVGRALEVRRGERRSAPVVSGGMRWRRTQSRSYELELQCALGGIGRTNCVAPIRAHWR